MSVLLARTAALAARPVAAVIAVMAPRGPLQLPGTRTAAGDARAIVPPAVTGPAAARQLPAALCAAVAGRAPVNAGSR
ncbi:hypothetical protein ACFYXD_37520 [Streptomyces platensis]|uniref:hypothetical protein n=1 Tax=Streptomyces platensis TaxID=58346 RepID=UPI0036C05562